jgi:hypothetical protein
MKTKVLQFLILVLSFSALAEEVEFYSVPKRFYEKQNEIFHITYQNKVYPQLGNLVLDSKTLFLSSENKEIIDETPRVIEEVYLSNLTAIQKFNQLEIRTSSGSFITRDLKTPDQSRIKLDLNSFLKKLNVQKKQRNEKIEICFEAKSNDGALRVCLPRLYVRFEQDKLLIRSAKIVYDAYVDLNNKFDYKNDEKVKIAFSSEDPLSVFMQSSSGYSIEFEGTFSSRDFINFSKNQEGNITILSKSKLNLANGVETSSMYTKPESSIFKIIGFTNSIGHFKPFYKYENVLAQSQIGVMNSFELESQIDLGMFEFLDDSSRPKVTKKSFQISSYNKSKNILLNSKNDITYIGDNFKVESDGKYWVTEADKINIYNENILQFEINKNKYLATHLMYRTYPGQISARISNTFTVTNEQLLSTEYNLQYWFENIFGLENYYLSTQRWGIEAQAFQSLKKFNISDTESKYDNTSANIKYRFSPGVWNYDETFGFILGYQNFSLLNERFPMAGFGLFWSRSMPRVFDDIINLVPFFRKQKWVSVDLTYYNTSLDKDKRTKSSNYKLNFYGKMLWTSRFFTEIGFGMRAHDLEIKSTQTEIQFQTYYGVFGLGLDF